MTKHTDKIIEKIANTNNVSVYEVRKEIQTAINIAFENPNENARKVPCKGVKPTIEEFLAYTTSKILNPKF